MSALQHVSPPFPGPDSRRADSFARSLLETLLALLNPREVIEQVQEWRELTLRADRLEASRPDAAAALRRQAARIGRS